MPTSLRFQIRGDTAEGWATKNPKLLAREIGYDTTTRRLKVGDGSKLWDELEFLPPDVVDDLEAGGSEAALSAEQGKRLKELVDGKAEKSDLAKLEQDVRDIVAAGGVSVIDNLTSTSKIAALSANQGRVLDSKITTLQTNLTTQINSSKVTVENNLTSTSSVNALSANQGRILKGLIDSSKTTVINNLTTNNTTAALSAAQGRVLKGLIDALTASKVTVENNLTSTSAVNALSANQGRVLKGLIDSSKTTVINNLTTNNTTAALSAAQGQKLDNEKLAKSAVTTESWTFTLESGSTVTKKVCLWV